MEKNSQALTTALLVMDVQPTILPMLGDNTVAYVNTIKKAIAAARRNNMLVLAVVVGFRKGFPEITAQTSNASFAALKAGAMPGLENPVPDPSLELTADDIVITKRRVSAFAGSDLEVILRGHKIDHIVLTGIATSGVVLSTLRQAADMDYRISVLSDACADRDAEVHNVLVNKVFPRQAEVLTTDQWIAGLGQSPIPK
ncbi:isochorismatase family cysteine hydrolase [Puia sp.]|jgi:nicotinamidase-related amidase|uniref:cysteine hydrolase family protein n=1 Tax=Puia sp. TaxID=2045100 RepID=UPI002F4123B2